MQSIKVMSNYLVIKVFQLLLALLQTPTTLLCVSWRYWRDLQVCSDWL